MLPKSTDTIICMTDSQVEDIKSLFKEKIEKKSIKIPPIHSINRWLIKEPKQDSLKIGHQDLGPQDNKL